MNREDKMIEEISMKFLEICLSLSNREIHSNKTLGTKAGRIQRRLNYIVSSSEFDKGRNIHA